MGISFWFPFIRRKGYNPALLYQSIIAKIAPDKHRRLDVLGTCYQVIRNSYSNNPPDVAHRMLEKEVRRYGSSLDMSLYIDGYQAVEKSYTAAERERPGVVFLLVSGKSLGICSVHAERGLDC
ncbi:hypothetical protein K457DRAFT_24319 [Linnemannia elongata AG-77]|uniref:Uncharacterized protein n=1 Tax=Linnemannia elongata AG-77 TaxID=1314771 RepID=A0A197JI44_9FUNG|nr:hypothetical protein K457DRAFT_24319 [Linnemannia elongata AG-77]